MSIIERIKAIRVGLIDDWSKFYKLASVWAFLALGAMPDIYNQLAAMGLTDKVPSKFAWIVNGMAASGVVLRVLKVHMKHDDHDDNSDHA